jgi:uncharacterized protein YaaQ|tara:strand:+ start:448 stop:639 length:192 start_codon:yes stop_codon:yes gene_type:complete
MKTKINNQPSDTVMKNINLVMIGMYEQQIDVYRSTIKQMGRTIDELQQNIEANKNNINQLKEF